MLRFFATLPSHLITTFPLLESITPYHQPYLHLDTSRMFVYYSRTTTSTRTLFQDVIFADGEVAKTHSIRNFNPK